MTATTTTPSQEGYYWIRRPAGEWKIVIVSGGQYFQSGAGRMISDLPNGTEWSSVPIPKPK